jgi:hypothetical protein
MKQLTLATVGFERYVKTTRRATFLAEMAAKVDPYKAAHRLRIVQRLFHRRVRQIEPLLQE